MTRKKPTQVGGTDRAAGQDSKRAERWEQLWRTYHEVSVRNPAVSYRHDLVLSAIARAQVRPLRILDVGCGQGDLLVEARRRFPEADLAGVDLSEVGLAYARARVPGVRLLRADLSGDQPFPEGLDGFATHVVCSEVIEHLDHPERVLRNIRPVLAPAGQLLVTVPAGPMSPMDVHWGHRRHYWPAELEGLLARCGYEPIVVRGAGFPFFNLYKLAVILSGERLVQHGDEPQPLSPATRAGMTIFQWLFRLNLARTRLGWQVFGVFQGSSSEG